MRSRPKDAAFKVLIAGAGGAAHLPGMVAAHTTLPVLGVPVQSKALSGLDSLLSIVQMPAGIPVATVAIGKAGATNAGAVGRVGAGPVAAGTWRKTEAVSPRRGRPRAGRNAAVTQAILPGATIGVLGSGQLGRMFAIAARRMGYRVHTLSPDDDTPTGQVADREIRSAYDDLDAIRDFARRVDLVTFEFENIPAQATDTAAEIVPVRPSGSVLYVTQHRLREKNFLREHGFPVVPFVAVRSLDELSAAIDTLGCPAVLKTAGWGYDGKGQCKLASPADAARAWATVGGGEAVLEAFIDFDREVSVVAARGLDGAVADYRHGLEHARQPYSRRDGGPVGRGRGRRARGPADRARGAGSRSTWWACCASNSFWPAMAGCWSTSWPRVRTTRGISRSTPR